MFIKITEKDGTVSYRKPRGFMSEEALFSVAQNSIRLNYKGAKTELVSRVPRSAEKPHEVYYEGCDLETFGNKRDIVRMRKTIAKLKKREEKARKKTVKRSSKRKN